MEAVEEKKAEKPAKDARVDEFALEQFRFLGFNSPLPDALVQTYNDYKRVKDRLNPRALSAEGFAFVVSLYLLRDRIDRAFGEAI